MIVTRKGEANFGVEKAHNGYLPGTDDPNTTCSWSAKSKYVVSGQVVYDGVFYISKTANTGKKAPNQNSEDWQRMTGPDKPSRGEYSSQVKDYGQRTRWRIGARIGFVLRPTVMDTLRPRKIPGGFKG